MTILQWLAACLILICMVIGVSSLAYWIGHRGGR